MDECMIVAYLALNWLSPYAIYKHLIDTLRSNAVAYSFVTHSLREACYLPSDQVIPSVEDDRSIDEAD
jgi:ABC-type nitrate/sulfonate/bicarbonate transport system ATPase subunit